MGKATIIGFSPNLAAMISSGGRISTMEGTAGEIWQRSLELGEEKNERLIGKVVSSGHTSVLEHGYVNLSFEDVSVFAEQFLIEFRLASFTVKSRRYVDFSNCGWVTPFEDAARAAVYDAEVRRLFGVYDALCAAGVPKEDARFVLPYGFQSNFFCSMNARELVHVMNELTYGRGAKYAELRALGESLFAQCEAQAPYLALRKEREYAVQPPAVPAGEALRCDAAVTLLDGTAEPEWLICRAGENANGTGRRADAGRAGRAAPPAAQARIAAGELYAALWRDVARGPDAPHAASDAGARCARSAEKCGLWPLCAAAERAGLRNGGGLPRGVFRRGGVCGAARVDGRG